jgi:hypothetical protein
VAIAFRSSSSGDVDGSAGIGGVTITKPSGFASTDILVLTISARGSVGLGAITLTAPAGWTAIATPVNTNDGTNRLQLWGYVALGNVASLNFTSGSATLMNMGWSCAAFTGADNTTPVDAAGTPNSGTVPDVANSVTVVTANSWHILCAADLNNHDVSAGSFTAANNSPASFAACAVLYNTSPKSAGATGTVSVGIGVSDPADIVAAVPFALRPVVPNVPHMMQGGFL